MGGDQKAETSIVCRGSGCSVVFVGAVLRRVKGFRALGRIG